MNKLFKNTNPHTPEVPFVFEHDGMVIDNPLWNSNMTGHVNPEYYGFKVWDTGGGCTAHGQEFMLDGEPVSMMIVDYDKEVNHVDDQTLRASVEILDKDGFSIGEGVFWEVTR